MNPTSSKLPHDARRQVIDALNASLADALDLYTQIKFAHWNLKGPHFTALHPLLDEHASATLSEADDLAERAVALGGVAQGTARVAASRSRLAEYDLQTVRDLDHVKALIPRYDAALDGLRAARSLADELGDDDTADMITSMTTALEKRAWYLHATVG